WDSALRAGTYTIAVCIAILGLWRTIVAFRSGRPRDLALAAFLLGLMVTGHMSFLLPVAVLGLALAGRAIVARQRVVASLLLLAGAFALGLTPFLYVPWADGRSYPMNYLRLVDTVFDPAGLHNPYLTTPIKRFAWMLFGRNELPTPPLHLDAVVAAKRLWHAALTLFLFELGPLASPLIVVGLVRRARHELGIALALAGALVASLAVPALVNTGFMMGVFLIPCTLLCSIFAADGLAGALDAAGRRRPGAFRAAALAVVAPVLLVLPAHLIRIYTYDHPLGPRHDIQVPEHDERQVRSVIPTMRDYWGPRRFGEQAMAAIPPDALVAAQWGPMTVLDYFRWVEGRRPDLTILTSDPRIVRHWRETHDLAKRPIVFVNRTPDAAPYLAHADSLEVAWGQWLYVVRSAPGGGAE
ncbi:MAG TPA: hypothetical protein VI792_10025, partial [Candidatus Eisenbacteria bacterium]